MPTQSGDIPIAATSTDSALVTKAVRQAAWRLIPLLAIGYLISVIDRTNIGFAALTMNKEVGLSATQFGFAGGMFYVGYVFFELPSNLALRQVGARRWRRLLSPSWIPVWCRQQESNP